MKKIGMFINVLILVFGIACIVYYFALGIAVRFGQSLMFLWPVVGGLCILRFIIWSVIYRTGKFPPVVPLKILRILILIGIVVFLAVECVIYFGGNVECGPNVDYIVVLGAKVNGTEPGGALRNRIQRASEYLKENPDTIAILSGGKGVDEGISEAQCMFNGLVERGIAPERLVLEDKSTDTAENLINSRALIGDDSKHTAIVTNNFHIFRTLCLARNMKWHVDGIPVATSLISFPHYMMREFVGVVYETIRGNLSFK